MTKREMFNLCITLAAGNDELIAALNHELELLDRKNKAPKGPTARQLENENIATFIASNIGVRSFTITEMIKELGLEAKFGEVSVSRITAVCTKMVENGVLVKEIVKRQSRYAKA